MFENFALAAVGIQLILNFLKAKKEGLTFFLDWLSRQSEALSVLLWTHISKRCFNPLFVIPYQIGIQNVNEFPDAYSAPIPVVKHFVL